jgi:hypothetical protein
MLNFLSVPIAWALCSSKMSAEEWASKQPTLVVVSLKAGWLPLALSLFACPITVY